MFLVAIRLAALMLMARQRVPAAPPPWARQSWATWVKDVDNYPGLPRHAGRRDKETLPRHDAWRGGTALPCLSLTKTSTLPRPRSESTERRGNTTMPLHAQRRGNIAPPRRAVWRGRGGHAWPLS
jgi:hypothetical protein